MAVTNSAVAVAGDGILICDPGNRPKDNPLVVEVYADGVDIYVGGSTVTQAGGTRGRKIANGNSAIYALSSGDKLYAAGTAASAIVLSFGA